MGTRARGLTQPGGESGPFHSDRAFKGQAEEVVYATLVGRKASQCSRENPPQREDHWRGSAKATARLNRSPDNHPVKARAKCRADAKPARRANPLRRLRRVRPLRICPTLHPVPPRAWSTSSALQQLDTYYALAA